ncbi:MAG: alpha/beta fold hydrolase [Bacilli bacterium]
MKKIIYNFRNKEFSNVLYLHGWGQTKESLYAFDEILNKNTNSIFVDLPPIIKENLYLNGIDNYLDYLKSLLKKEQVDHIDLIIAHSFGGKLAMEYVLNIKDTPMVLLAPSIIKEKSIKNYICIIFYKLAKLLKWQKFINRFKGSLDYQRTKNNELYRKNFLSIINTFYDKKIKKIKSKVIVVRGKDDDQISDRQCRKMQNNFQKCIYLSLDGNHFCYKRHIQLISDYIDKELL